MTTTTNIVSTCGKFILTSKLIFKPKFISGFEYIEPSLMFIDVIDGECLGTWTNSKVLINDVFPTLLNNNPIAEDDDCIIDLEDYPTLIEIFTEGIKLGFFVTV